MVPSALLGFETTYKFILYERTQCFNRFAAQATGSQHDLAQLLAI